MSFFGREIKFKYENFSFHSDSNSTDFRRKSDTVLDQ